MNKFYRNFLILLGLLIILVPIYFSFTNTTNDKYLVVYNDKAYYSYPITLEENITKIPLYDYVDFKSIFISANVSSYLISYRNETDYKDLFDQNINKTIVVYDEKGNKYEGKLLKYDSYLNVVYLDINGSIFLLHPDKTMFYNSSFLSHDTYLLVNSNKKQQTRISYLLDGISWYPMYNIYIQGDNAYFSLQGVFTNSIEDFKDTYITLFYKYSDDSMEYPLYKGMNFEMIDTEVKQNEDFYKFNLGKTDLLKGTSKKPLFEKYVDYERYYTFDLSQSSTKGHLNIIYEINNTKNNIGIALPGGKVYMYSENDFIGDSYIPATALNETITLNLGKAYDIYLKETLLNRTVIKKYDKYKDYVLRDYKLEIQNQKPTIETIKLYYYPTQNWTIEGINYEKINNNKVLFLIKMPPKTKKTISFKVKQVESHWLVE